MYLKLETFHKKKKFKNVREQKKSFFYICTIYGRINRSFLMFYDKSLCFLMNSTKKNNI